MPSGKKKASNLEKATFLLHLRSGQLEQLKRLAKQDDVPVSHLIREAIKQYLASRA